jgi:hypothetical protein
LGNSHNLLDVLSPASFSAPLDILKKRFPLDWDKQRQMLGFTHLPSSNPTGKISV